MTLSRPALLMIVVPVAFTLALGGLIFGGQALSDSDVDGEIQHALATALHTSGEIELSNLQDVNYGYGVCGLYKSSLSADGYASFFYDKQSDSVTLDVNSRRFTSNCGLSSIC